jgi:hypothetical protein
MKLFLEFHLHGKKVKSLNVTFIYHIPKKVGAVEVKYFHPIGLVSGIFKLIVKVLANRLKIVLENIISKTQNTLLRGQILN